MVIAGGFKGVLVGQILEITISVIDKQTPVVVLALLKDDRQRSI